MEDCISGVPHSFYVADFYGPTLCDFCGGFIWGLSKQGYQCSGSQQYIFHSSKTTVCEYASHKRCLHKVSRNCSLNSPLAKKMLSSAVVRVC